MRQRICNALLLAIISCLSAYGFAGGPTTARTPSKLSYGIVKGFNLKSSTVESAVRARGYRQQFEILGVITYKAGGASYEARGLWLENLLANTSITRDLAPQQFGIDAKLIDSLVDNENLDDDTGAYRVYLYTMDINALMNLRQASFDVFDD